MYKLLLGEDAARRWWEDGGGALVLLVSTHICTYISRPGWMGRVCGPRTVDRRAWDNVTLAPRDWGSRYDGLQYTVM